MIPLPSGVRVWPATGHTGMRRGMNGLALPVQGYRQLGVLALLDRHGDLHLRALRRRLCCTACGACDAELIRATALRR